MRTLNRKQSYFLLLVIFACLLSSACTKSTTPATPWEKVTAYNATFAEANEAIEAGTQSLVATQILTVAQAQPVINFTLRAAQIHQQITALLGTGTSITGANVTQILALLQQFQTAASALISNGSLGVKNPQTQNSLSQDIAGLISIGTLITNLLPQLEASPAPTSTPAAPASKGA